MSAPGDPRGVGGEISTILYVADDHPFSDRFGHYRPSVTLNDYADVCHHIAKETGWWTNTEKDQDPDASEVLRHLRNYATVSDDDGCHGLAEMVTMLADRFEEKIPKVGDLKIRNKAELLFLIISEVVEAGEGARKDLMDDKLPHRKMLEVELADTLIRIFDFAGGYGLDLEGALREKLAYNKTRLDHRPEEREKEGGKRW